MRAKVRLMKEEKKIMRVRAITIAAAAAAAAAVEEEEEEDHRGFGPFHSWGLERQRKRKSKRRAKVSPKRIY